MNGLSKYEYFIQENVNSCLKELLDTDSIINTKFNIYGIDKNAIIPENFYCTGVCCFSGYNYIYINGIKKEYKEKCDNLINYIDNYLQHRKITNNIILFN